ncbi:hypothetical protein [Flavobacterium sp.]|uniref:hypothetical protein n=1 Tax=Flavobacterium sp. TaxID=239 RepID=UPI003C675D50
MKKTATVVLLIMSGIFSYAQGCSDAGICTIGQSFETEKADFKNSIEFATVFGKGESDVTYFSPYITYTRKVNEQFSLATKITFSSANGSFGTRASFGDAYLIGNYTLKEENQKQWSFLTGFKFPFTSSNLKINEYSIPLDYQASLGTFDLFLGTNYKIFNWDFNLALQIPVFNNNKNSFFKEYAGTNDFPSTNLFERKSDALFRTTYNIKTTNQKWVFKPSVLFIYHLGEDSYETIYNKRETIKDSDGLTINGNIVSFYKINSLNSIGLSLAAPFAVRTTRPDGLTRSFVASIQYIVQF